MADITFYKPNDIDYSLLKFNRVHHTSLRKFTNVHLNKKKVGLILPDLKLLYNVNQNLNNQWVIKLNLNNNPQLLESLQKLDIEMIKHAELNKKEWFGIEDYTDISNRYFSFVKDDNYKNTEMISVKIPISRKDNTFDCSFYSSEKDSENNNIKLTIDSDEKLKELLKQDTKLSLAIMCSGLWINEKQFGLTWVLYQTKVHQQPQVKQKDQEEINDFADSDSDNDSDDFKNEYMFEESDSSESDSDYLPEIIE